MAGRVVQLGCVAAFPWALCIVQGRGRYDILGQSILGQSTFDMGMDRTGFRNDLKKKSVNFCKYSTPIEFKLLVKIIHIPHVFCALLMNFRTTCIGRKVSSKSSCGRPFTTKKWYPQYFRFLIAIILINLFIWALFYILCFTHQCWQVEKQACFAVTGRERELFTRGKFFSLGVLVK